jgi:hypothetical protein
MKVLLLILILPLIGCSMPKHTYEVHLVDGGGTHHLITTDTEDEAMDFIDSQEDSHGAMKIIKQRKD